MSTDCIFCRVAAGELPAETLYEDELVVAFRDIHPVAPHHVLIIPREHLPTVNDFAEQHGNLLGRMMLTAQRLARQLQFDKKGYRLVMNCNRDGGQSVYHAHLHLLGGKAFAWPPG